MQNIKQTILKLHPHKTALYAASFNFTRETVISVIDCSFINRFTETLREQETEEVRFQKDSTRVQRAATTVAHLKQLIVSVEITEKNGLP
jgi:hypothetical protein